MLRDEVLRIRREDKPALDAFGVKAIGVFGSVARGEDDERSDIDIIVHFREDAPMSLATPNSPNRRANERIKNEAVYA